MEIRREWKCVMIALMKGKYLTYSIMLVSSAHYSGIKIKKENSQIHRLKVK